MKALAFSILGLGILATIQPFLWLYVADSAKAWKNTQTQEEQLRMISSRIESAQKKYEEAVKLTEQLELSFPYRGSEPQLVERVEQLADRYGVKLSVSNISEIPSQQAQQFTGLVPLSVTLKAQGEIVKLLSYFEALEHIQEVMQVREWDLHEVQLPAAAAEEKPIKSTELTMNIVFFLQDGTQK